MKVFDHVNFNSFKSDLIQPVTFDFMTNSGSCGSYSSVLSRLLTELNIENRIVQMRVNGLEAGHVIVEAKSSKGWMVLDPSYNFSSKNPMVTSLLSTKFRLIGTSTEIRFLKTMTLVTGMKASRYTNWDKIPVLLPILKQTLIWTIGKEKTDVFL